MGYLSNNGNPLSIATIQSCYNLGNVSTVNGNSAGGIAGIEDPNCIISYCYNAGKVTGSTHAYAISYPINVSSKVTNCYYDSSVCSANGTNVTGLSTANLKSLPSGLVSSFSKASASVNNGYPILTAFPATTTTTTTTLTSLTTATMGNLVTFTATIDSSSINLIPNNEQVNFYDGTTLIGMGTTLNGVATFSISTLPPGVHVITAEYIGDVLYGSSTSTPASFNINLPGSTQSNITLTSTNTNGIIIIGSSVAFQATLSPSSCTGQVVFIDGDTLLSFINISNGSATLTIPSLSVGEHNIRAIYFGDSTYNLSESNILTQKVYSSTTTTLTSPQTTISGSPVTFTAKILTASSDLIPNNAHVDFYDMTNGTSTLIGTGNTLNGVATFSASSLFNGVHFITASYNGDATHIPSKSAPTCLIVGMSTMTPPAITLTSTNTSNFSLPTNYSPAGGQVTFGVSTSIPDGERITFWDDTTQIGSITISNGIATYSKVFEEIGTQTITATYSGNYFYAGTSASLTLTIVPKIQDPVIQNAYYSNKQICLDLIYDGNGGRIADITPIKKIINDPTFQNSTVVVNVTQPGAINGKTIIKSDGISVVPIITSAMLEQLQKLHSTIIFQIYNSDGTIRYIWKLDGNKFDDIPYSDLNVNLLITNIGATVQKSNPNLLKSNSDLLKGVILNFANDGLIPCSTISINLSSMQLSYNTTSPIYCYLLNPDNSIDVSSMRKYYFDEYDFITLDFTHNSNYILTLQQLSNTGNNTNLPIIFIITGLALILILSFIILRRKKKINNNYKSI